MTIRDDRTSEPETGGARRRAILEIAARLFARKGYRGTSMRDIGEAAGVQGGSLYHHIRSKDALFVELHHAALDEAERRIAQAASQQLEPWARLEAACAALLEIQLDPDSLTMPMMNDFREDGLRERIAAAEAGSDWQCEYCGSWIPATRAGCAGRPGSGGPTRREGPDE